MSSAVMSLLYLAQNQNDNWIPLSAIKYIAKMLNMPYIKVYEVCNIFIQCLIYLPSENILFKFAQPHHA